jgi:hypothetical protein
MHVRRKKTALHADDLRIILNVVNANESLNESNCTAYVLARRARALILGGRARAQRHLARRADSPANSFSIFSDAQQRRQHVGVPRAERSDRRGRDSRDNRHHTLTVTSHSRCIRQTLTLAAASLTAFRMTDTAKPY